MTARSSTSNSELPRQRVQRRARRVMLWCAVALLLSPIPGGMLVDYCPLRFRFPEAASLQDQWRETDPHASILLLGSSRMGSFSQSDELAGDARQLTGDNSLRVFNAAIPAADPITVDFIATRLLSTGKSPRLALIEISPDFLAHKSMFFPISIKRQMVATDLPRYISDIFFSGGKAISSLIASRLTPFYRHRTILQEWFESGFTSAQTVAPTIMTTSEKAAPDKAAPEAFAAVQPPLSPETPANNKSFGQNSAQSALVYGRNLRNYQLKGATSAALEHAVALLRAHGSTVVLVQMPLSTPFRALFTQDMENQYSAYVQHLQTVYGCSFVNLRDRLPDTAFGDMHHGNMEGSREFCRILAREVVAPIWTKQ